MATTPHPLCIFPESSDAAVGRLWAEGKSLADRCYEKLKDIGEYVGTAYTTRDVMQIVDAIDEGTAHAELLRQVFCEWSSPLSAYANLIWMFRYVV